jgi:hypothetical protein
MTPPWGVPSLLFLPPLIVPLYIEQAGVENLRNCYTISQVT